MRGGKGKAGEEEGAFIIKKISIVCDMICLSFSFGVAVDIS